MNICKISCRLLLSDIAENRLKVAKDMGADHTILVSSGDAEAIAKEVEKVMGGMPDITIECSGAESSIRLGIFVSTKLQGGRGGR